MRKNLVATTLWLSKATTRIVIMITPIMATKITANRRTHRARAIAKGSARICLCRNRSLITNNCTQH